MEIDYTVITPEMEEMYGLNEIEFNLALPEKELIFEDADLDTSVFEDNIEFIFSEMVRKYSMRKQSVKYAAYHKKLTIDDAPRKSKSGNLLVRCKYCRKYFKPNLIAVSNRILALNGKYISGGENNFYCSKSCKEKCPVYNSRGALSTKTKRDPSYAKQSREMALERSDYKCEICGVSENLEVHHVKPFKTDPIEAYDLDNLITLCRNCHKKYGHSDKGCRLQDLRRCKSKKKK